MKRFIAALTLSICGVTAIASAQQRSSITIFTWRRSPRDPDVPKGWMNEDFPKAPTPC